MSNVVSRIVKAAYDSICMTCKDPIQQGTDCHWAKGRGVWHTDCSPPRDLHAPRLV